METEYRTFTETCKDLNRCKASVLKLLNEQTLEGYKDENGRWKITKKSIDKYLNVTLAERMKMAMITDFAVSIARARAVHKIKKSEIVRLFNAAMEEVDKQNDISRVKPSYFTTARPYLGYAYTNMKKYIDRIKSQESSEEN